MQSKSNGYCCGRLWVSVLFAVILVSYCPPAVLGATYDATGIWDFYVYNHWSDECIPGEEGFGVTAMIQNGDTFLYIDDLGIQAGRIEGASYEGTSAYWDSEGIIVQIINIELLSDSEASGFVVWGYRDLESDFECYGGNDIYLLKRETVATYDATGVWDFTMTIDTCYCVDFMDQYYPCGDTGSAVAGQFTLTQNDSSFRYAEPGFTMRGIFTNENYIGFDSYPEDDGSAVFSLILSLDSATTGTGYADYYWTDGWNQCWVSSSLIVSKTSIVNNPPGQPTLSSPADGATAVSLTPTLVTGPFADPDSGGTHKQTEWQIGTMSDFSTVVFSTISSSNLTSLTVPTFVLAEGTTHYWRVRYYDNHLSASDWSEGYSFTTLTANADQNGNGIPDSQENNTVDLNNNGIPDAQETDKIKSLNTTVGGGQVGVAPIDSSGQTSAKVTSIDSIESIDPSEVSSNARPYMPLGLFGLGMTVANPTDEGEVTIYFSEPAPAGATWFMYDPVNGWVDYSSKATFSADRMSVTIKLKDWGFGDADGTPNGTIMDPGGFGVASWIQGDVSDGVSGQAITGATITVADLNLTCTDAGKYASMILPGTYTVTASAPGYQTATYENVVVSEGGVLERDVTLTATTEDYLNITSLSSSAAPTMQAGDTVTFTANAAGSVGDVYYRFDLIPNYGTNDYDPFNNFQTIQNFSESKSCTHTFTQSGGYIIVVWASPTASFPATDRPIIGGSVSVGGSGSVSITALDMSTTGTLQAGDSVTFTASGTSATGGDIYYRFDLIPNYGTNDYDPFNNFQTIQNFSKSKSCTHTFTQSGGYIIVVWASPTASFPATERPIIGGSITVK
jgi:plastocyanin